MGAANEAQFALYIDLINGKLPEDKEQELKKEIQENPGMAAEFKEAEEFVLKMKYMNARSKMSAILQQIRDEEEEESTQLTESETWKEEPVEREVIEISWWQRPSVWAAAASVAVAVGLGVWFILKNIGGGPVPADRVAEDHPALQEMVRTLVREPLEVANVPQKFDSERESVEHEMETEKAIASLENFADNNGSTMKPDSGDQRYGGPADTKPGISREEDGYRLLLIGIGYLKQENAAKALSAFGEIKFEGLSQDVRWYKALAYLQAGNDVKAREELLQITDKRYSGDAKELLNKLP